MIGIGDVGWQAIVFTDLEEKLDQSKRHVDQYKSIADGMEESLKEQNEASRQFQESLEAQLNEARQGIVGATLPYSLLFTSYRVC